MARPDYGERSVDAWSASTFRGGSPGQADPEVADPLDGVTINEFLAHTDLPQVDFIELYNRGTQTVDLSGCGLSDRADTNKFIIPAGTQLAPGGWVVFSETDLGFALSSQGDAHLPGSRRRRSGDRCRALRRAGQRRLVGTLAGRSARHPRARADRRPARPTVAPSLHDIVINEIMYHPISGQAEDEYVELHNRGSHAVDVGYWRFVDGIDFMIPPGTVIPAGGYLVVARDRANLLTKYAHLDATNTVGDYEGELSDRGERVVLARPDDPGLPFQDFVVVDEVTYSDGWGHWTDGGGSSLELIDAHADNALGPNWQGSDETAKAPWTDIEHTGVIDNQAGTMEELQVFCPQTGECLLDNIELKSAGETVNRVTNAGFEGGLSGWERLGSHERSEPRDHRAVTPGAGPARARDEPGPLHHLGLSHHLRPDLHGDHAARCRPDVHDPCPGPLDRGLALHRDWGQGPRTRGRGRPRGAPATSAPPARRTAGASPTQAPPSRTCSTHRCCRQPLKTWSSPPGFTTRTAWPPSSSSGASDPATGRVTTTPMTDPDGDGVYRATLPGQAAGQIVAFAVEATDAAGAPVTSRFPGPPPTGAPVLECLVRFGDTLAPGVFGTYRLWVSSTNVARWQARETRSNEPVDSTFTYDDYRTVYNATIRYRGNWRTLGFDDYREAAYVVGFPKTERVLGDTEVAIDFISLNGDNGTRQQEKHAYWMARQVDLASIAMRYVRVSVNGSALFRYDSLSPSRIALHQLVWRRRSARVRTALSARAFRQLPHHRQASRNRRNTATPCARRAPPCRTTITRRVSDRGCAGRTHRRSLRGARVRAGRHPELGRLLGDQPHVRQRGPLHLSRLPAQPVYLHPPLRAIPAARERYGWRLWHRLQSLSRTPGYLPGIMFAKPEFRRVYWRLASDVVRGPMDPAVSGARLLDWYQVFRDHDISAVAPTAMNAWITARRAAFIQELATVTNVAFEVSTPSLVTNATPLTVRGRAPIAVTAIQVNGQAHAVKWLGETTWQIRVALAVGTNVLVFHALDAQGAVVGSDTLTVTYTGPSVSLEDKLVISEIMYHPAAPASSFVEIHNLSSTETLPLGGLRVDGIDATIGHGRFIEPGGYAVVAGSLPGYQSSYGNAEVVVARIRWHAGQRWRDAEPAIGPRHQSNGAGPGDVRRRSALAGGRRWWRRVPAVDRPLARQ